VSLYNAIGTQRVDTRISATLSVRIVVSSWDDAMCQLLWSCLKTSSRHAGPVFARDPFKYHASKRGRDVFRLLSNSKLRRDAILYWLSGDPPGGRWFIIVDKSVGPPRVVVYSKLNQSKFETLYTDKASLRVKQVKRTCPEYAREYPFNAPFAEAITLVAFCTRVIYWNSARQHDSFSLSQY